jgi:hypothetical protein
MYLKQLKLVTKAARPSLKTLVNYKISQHG